MSHTVTVTKLPSDESDDYEYELGGECDYRCETWRPCTKDWHRHPKNEWPIRDEWSTKRVPQVHHWIEGEWMVPTGECAWHFVRQDGYPFWGVKALGVYEVDIDWDGDLWWASLTPADSGSEQ